MKGLTRFTTLIIAAMMLTGCGTAKMAMRPDATANVHTIALIKVSEPDAFVANDFGNPGIMFGGIGGAVAGASAANATKSVHAVVTNADYAAGDHFTRLLTEKLSSQGYQVHVISVPREKKQKLLESYASVDAGSADAILDVAIENIGYATEHPMFSRHWRPASAVKVALVDSRSGEKVYMEKFMYGYHNPLLTGTDIEAPTTYHFKNKQALFADDAKLVAGIQNSVEAVTDHVTHNLKK